MKKWLRWRDLKGAPLNLNEPEILDYIEMGLQPYNRKTKQPLDCPDYCHLYFRKEKRLKEIGLQLASEQLSLERRKQLENEKQDILWMWGEIAENDSITVSWEYFVLPTSEKRDQKPFVMLEESEDDKPEEQVQRLIEMLDEEAVFSLEELQRLAALQEQREIEAIVERYKDALISRLSVDGSDGVELDDEEISDILAKAAAIEKEMAKLRMMKPGSITEHKAQKDMLRELEAERRELLKRAGTQEDSDSEKSGNDHQLRSGIGATERSSENNSESTGEEDDEILFRKKGSDVHIDGPSESADTIIFRQNGKTWVIGIEGRQKVAISHLEGFRYIKYLLENPQRFVTIRELYYLGEIPVEVNTLPSSSQEIMDSKTERKVRNLLEELAKKRDNERDEEERERLNEQIREYNNHLSRSSRYFNSGVIAGSHSEYSKIKKAIDRARDRIKECCPEVWEYLNTHTIKTGNRFQYDPLPEHDGIRWITE